MTSRLPFFLLAILLALVTWVAFRSSSPHDAPAGESLDSLVSTRLPVATRATDDQPPDTASSHGTAPSLAELVKLAESMLAHLRNDVRDYQAILIKRERIQGTLGPEVRMDLKIRNPPAPRQAAGERQSGGLAAYLKFMSPRSAQGREVIWIENQNNNRLTVHEGGFKNLLRLELDPHGMLAMTGNKYPITEIGLLRLLEKLIEKCSGEVDMSRCEVQVIENQKVGDRQCRLYQVTQPREAKGADFHIAQVFVDSERQIPLRYAAFLWPTQPGDTPPLEEEYTYLDLRLNVGLSDADFDPDNPNYQFP